MYSGEELEDEIGWIFAVTGEITKDVENEEHEALADTGACRSVCPLDFATHVTMTPAPTELKLNTASGKKLKIFGIRIVKVRLTTDQGDHVLARLTFVVTEVRNPILALATLCDNGASFNLKNGIATIEKDSRMITVRRRGNLYFVPFVSRDDRTGRKRRCDWVFQRSCGRSSSSCCPVACTTTVAQQGGDCSPRLDAPTLCGLV